MGRPKKLPEETATSVVKVRLYSEDLQRLNDYCEKTNKNKTEAIREAIRSFPINDEIFDVDMDIYDQEETYPNCTVQVLTNTVTGKVSIGWWRNDICMENAPDEYDE